jgi:flagellar hook-associated protein 3 FlgL
VRVTQRTLQDSWIQNLQRRLGSLDQLNRQVGTGYRVQKPADDPSGANRIVRIEEVVARNEQYLKNIEESIAVGQTSEANLEQVYERLVRAKSLAVEGANDASASMDGSFAALAEEVDGIKGGILQLALSQYQGVYLFSGTAGGVAPFGPVGGRYQGDSNVLRVNMGNGLTVPVNLPGDRAFRETEARSADPLAESVNLAADLTFEASDGTVDCTVTVPAGTYTREDLAAAIDGALKGSGANLEARVEADGTLAIAIANTREGGEITLGDPTGDLQAVLGVDPGTKNLFGLLDDLKAALDSQDPSKVGKLLARLDSALDAVLAQRGELGSRGRNLEFARDRLQQNNLTNQTLQAGIEGVDLPEAVTRLTAEEQAYQTALAAGARIFNISIIDFLR